MEEKKTHTDVQNDAHFVAFCDMHAVAFVLPDRSQYCGALFLYRDKTTRGLAGQVIPNPIYTEKKILV